MDIATAKRIYVLWAHPPDVTKTHSPVPAKFLPYYYP